METQAFSNKHKHLEFLQTVINRMAGNSFLLKGWTITLIAALFALAAKDADKSYILIAYFPLLIFWYLDSYYLSQERGFRALYDQVREKPELEIDFSMNTKSINDKHRTSRANAFLSNTLVTYYGGLAVIMLVLMYTAR